MLTTIFRQIIVLFFSLLTLSIFTFTFTQFFPESIQSNFQMVNEGNNILLQYIDYIALILTGEWGSSIITGTSVLSEFLTYFPATIELSVLAMLFALTLGLPLGVFAAQHKSQWQDKLIVSTTLIGYSIPLFWWGMLLVLLFSLTLGITPVASRLGFEYDIVPVTGFMLIDTLISDQDYSVEAFYSSLKHLILPTIVLGTIPFTIFTRVTRSAMIDALSSDYVRTAKATGIPYGRIVWIHALRNAFISIITILGLQISILITGTLITETIFSWPGIGKWLLDAVNRRDLVTIHGALLAIASIIIVTNIFIEIITQIITPKLRRKK